MLTRDHFTSEASYTAYVEEINEYKQELKWLKDAMKLRIPAKVRALCSTLRRSIVTARNRSDGLTPLFVRDLMRETGMSESTVKSAIRICEQHGIISCDRSENEKNNRNPLFFTLNKRVAESPRVLELLLPEGNYGGKRTCSNIPEEPEPPAALSCECPACGQDDTAIHAVGYCYSCSHNWVEEVYPAGQADNQAEESSPVGQDEKPTMPCFCGKNPFGVWLSYPEEKWICVTCYSPVQWTINAREREQWRSNNDNRCNA